MTRAPGQHGLAAEARDHHLRRHLALSEAGHLHVLAQLARRALDAALDVLGVDVDVDADPRVGKLLYGRLHGADHDRHQSARASGRLALHRRAGAARLLLYRPRAVSGGTRRLRSPQGALQAAPVSVAGGVTEDRAVHQPLDRGDIVRVDLAAGQAGAESARLQRRPRLQVRLHGPTEGRARPAPRG